MQRPGDERREHRHLALGEVDDAGRAVDQHEREGQRRPRRRPTRGRSRSAARAASSRRRAALSSPRYERADGFVARAALALSPSSATRPDLEHVGARRGLERERRVLLDDQHGRARRARSARRRSGRSRRRRAARARATARRAAPAAAASISARASASICCSPPLSVPAGWSRRSPSQREVARARAPSSSRRRRRSRRVYAPSRRFSATVSSASVPRPSGTCAIPSRAIASGERPAMLLPAKRDPAAAPDRARDRAQRRRLAGAVRAEDRDDLALVDRERDAVQRRAPARSGPRRPRARAAPQASCVVPR